METYKSVPGSIIHVELNAEDQQATRTFYERTFGWTFDRDEEMDYTSWQAPNPPNGGLMSPESGPFSPPSTLFYIQVDDIAETGSAIREACGTIQVEEMEVPEMGVFTIFSDPGNVVIAVWEERYEGEPPEGGWPMFTDEPEPGSITHFELYSDDPESTQDFFERVFEWDFETIGDGEYTMCRPPTPPLGGVMQATDEMPAGTLAYLLVESAGDTCRAIESAEGQVLQEPFEVSGWGTMALFEAPGGIAQAIWESAPKDTDAETQTDTEKGTPASG